MGYKNLKKCLDANLDLITPEAAIKWETLTDLVLKYNNNNLLPIEKDNHNWQKLVNISEYGCSNMLAVFGRQLSFLLDEIKVIENEKLMKLVFCYGRVVLASPSQHTLDLTIQIINKFPIYRDSLIHN